MWAEVLRVLLGLVTFLAVLGLAYFVATGVGRYATGAGGPMRVVGQLALGPRRGVTLVRLGDELLLLGVTDHQVTLLERVSDPRLLERLDPPGKGGPEGARFRDFLAERLGRRRVEP
ncbi:MAG: flagellar biosynthetic protein FliO [Bacillota bacterium]|nr:flagellar biosynthetic protein FliO [Bacillota bacterium]